MNGNGEQLVPQPVSKRWKRRWQHEPVHHNVNADPVQHTRHNRMFPQKFDPPTGQVKNRYDHKRNEKMERQTEASRYQAAVIRARAQQSSSDSLQSAPGPDAALPPDHERGGNVQNTNDQTGSDDCAKRLRILHAIVTELTQKTRKSESKETIAAVMDQLMQICNLRCNGREATARLPICGHSSGEQNRRIYISSVFVFSCIPDLLLSLGHDALTHSNSNGSPDLRWPR
jgi:hypothetical protein